MYWSDLLRQDIQLLIFVAACVIVFLNTLLMIWLQRRSFLKRREKEYPITVPDRIIAGDHQGNNVRVVYRKEDRIGHVAFAHECGHELYELEGRVDYDHDDEAMWKRVIDPVKKELREAT